MYVFHDLTFMMIDASVVSCAAAFTADHPMIVTVSLLDAISSRT